MQLPPRPRNAAGEFRKAGFELEFGHLDVPGASRAVRSVFGGRIVQDNRFAATVQGTPVGDFRVEMDAMLLKRKEYEPFLREAGLDIDAFDTKKAVEKAILAVASEVVPCEIVTPPVPLDRLDDMERLREILMQKRAEGTFASLLYAFGLHINAEVPNTRPEFITADLLAYLRAFLLLYPLLEERTDVAVTRTISRYVAPFSEEFTHFFLQPDYAPATISQFTTDYLRLNPSRNRPLDLIPILAWVDEETVLAKAQEPQLIKKRPAFHYRLPNCLVDQAEWSIGHEWKSWLMVEILANDPGTLAAWSAEYLAQPGFPLNLFSDAQSDWLDTLRARTRTW